MNTVRLQKLRVWLLVSLCALWMPWKASAVGHWTPLVNPAPGGVCLMLLMPDGTVLAASRVTDPTENPPSNGSRLWYRLTPDIHGSYINGTWTNTADENWRSAARWNPSSSPSTPPPPIFSNASGCRLEKISRNSLKPQP